MSRAAALQKLADEKTIRRQAKVSKRFHLRQDPLDVDAAGRPIVFVTGSKGGFLRQLPPGYVLRPRIVGNPSHITIAPAETA